MGLEDSVELVRETFVKTEGEVRALVGFSQGATFIALLRRKLPELFKNVRKVVSIAGFDPLDEEAYAAAIDDDDDDGKGVKVKVESKSLHVHGANDALVTRDRCDRLETFFTTQRTRARSNTRVDTACQPRNSFARRSRRSYYRTTARRRREIGRRRDLDT